MKASTIRESRIVRLAAPLVFWIAVWWAVSAAVGKELLVPSPVSVAKRLGELLSEWDFWLAAVISLLRIFSGALMGAVLGIVFSLATCKSFLCDLILSPAIRVIRSVPVASFIILVLLWIRRGAVPAVISALMVMPVMWENVSYGIKATDPKMLEMAKSYSLGKASVIRRIYLPSVKPSLFSGIRSSLGLAWKSGVAAEVLCLPKSAIGTQIYYSKIYLETPSLFAWTITVIVLSALLSKLLFTVFREEKPQNGTGGRK